MPLLITGHEDKYIRVFDISTGKPWLCEGPRLLVFILESQLNARIRCWLTLMV